MHMNIHCEIYVLVEKSNSNPHVEENVPIRVSLRMTQNQHMINLLEKKYSTHYPPFLLIIACTLRVIYLMEDNYSNV